MLLLLNKPFQVLSQFSADGAKDTLAKYVNVPNVYPAGRLDYDSEGLLLLTDNGALQHLIASPMFKMPKTYWVQVEGEVTEQAILALSKGVELKDGMTKPAKCRRMDVPNIWNREPPIRERANIPTSWIELQITEGRNRQVRRMTAHVGFPTLRLIRAAIGPYSVENTPVGSYVEVELTETLVEQVQHFEREKARKAATSNRRRPNRGQAPLPHGKRNAGRPDRAQSASRTRGKR
ncbi:pseudouridine synthase [Marinomonas fungiae]|uniref:Pseudouridine synthase n=1 Tax=Marinomonas fungiae TaxID=1137284 RepID=A0A0K6IHE1_9GAMM|nr:pseudouridine synthase [Marinomonas fungiae]CUB02560.1 pseudouridine synthase [Marinomonas fungiae]